MMDIQVGLTKQELEWLLKVLQEASDDVLNYGATLQLQTKLQGRLDVLNERILVARGNM